MIHIRDEQELSLIAQAGRIAADARELAGRLIKPGVTTKAIDRQVAMFIRDHGAKPSFLGYNGFPGNICVSVI